MVGKYNTSENSSENENNNNSIINTIFGNNVSINRKTNSNSSVLDTPSSIAKLLCK